MSAQPARSGMAWTTEEDDQLRREFNTYEELGAVVVAHERTVAAVLTRMMHLGLLVNIGNLYYRVYQDPWASYASAKMLQKEIYGP